jgi:hypothetical protein
MSVKGKVLAAAATLSLLGGAGIAAAATAGAASAATPSCGKDCIDVFSHQFGTFADPQFVMDSYKQGDQAGTPVILFRTSDSDPAEDFTVDQEGFVSEFFAANLVTASVALQFGCIPAGTFGVCDGTGQGDYWAYEFMYSPYGVQTGLCTGVAATAVAGEKVTLQPCGVSGKTVWIADNPTSVPAYVSCAVGSTGCTADPCRTVGTHTTPGCPPGSNTGVSTTNGYEPNPNAEDHNPLSAFAEPLINGSDTNFSEPYALTYPASSYPTDEPRPNLYVTNLLGFSTGALNTNQLWSADEGVLP